MDIDTRLDHKRDAEHGISFQVHDVEPETPQLPQISMADSLKSCLRSGENFLPEVVAVSDLEGQYLKLPSQNGLLSAVHLAFSCHLPLTLSPDIIWLAILQGFGRQIHAHAKELEGRLMTHPGKHSIEVVFGETEWDWPMVFERFAQALEAHVGPWVRKLEADFSTTGKVERTASQVALMDLFTPYVQFIAVCICGIPTIHLQGQESDWIRLREKLRLLRGYDAENWIEEIDDILARFVDASRGNIDQAWWQTIYKLTPKYGGEDIEGWLGAFFPYLRDDQGTFKRRRVKDEKFTTGIVPPGLSDANVRFISMAGNDRVRFVSGFVGVEDLGPEGVAPKIGWAVVRNNFMENFVETLDEHPGIKTRPPARRDHLTAASRPSPWNSVESLPVDLQLFYHATDGADLFGKGVIHPLETHLKTENIGNSWTHLGAWNDGSLLLLAFDAIVRLRWDGVEWEYQTLARSFSGFIGRLTAANGHEYWKDDDFVEPEILPLWKEFHPPCPEIEGLNSSLEKLRRQNQRLRSMRLVKQDVFQIRPVTSEKRDHLPAALRSLYDICDGILQVDGFELWPASRIAAIPGTHGRWFAIGAAPGYGILFDSIANRGAAVIDRERQEVHQIARSLARFLSSVEKDPIGLYWEKVGSPYAVRLAAEFGRPNILWPDEHIDLPALTVNWAPLR